MTIVNMFYILPHLPDVSAFSYVRVFRCSSRQINFNSPQPTKWTASRNGVGNTEDSGEKRA